MKKPRPKRYTDEEIQYIRDHYPTEDTYLIARHLGRTPNGISQVAASRGIKKLPVGAIPIPRVKLPPAPQHNASEIKWQMPKGNDAMPWPLYFFKAKLITDRSEKKYCSR